MTESQLERVMAEEVQLDFENQMFIELLAEDGLVVLAR